MLDVDHAGALSPPPLPDLHEAVPGARLEACGPLWVAYSPASGQTHVLNDECAAVLEWLLTERRPADSALLAEAFHADTGVDTRTLTQTLNLAWVPLRVAGLVRRCADPVYPAAP